MKYYLTLKGNAVLIDATTWMNLENIMLCKITEDTKGQILYESTQVLGT
jgi:hypothetical protein